MSANKTQLIKDRLYKETRKYIPILLEANVMDSDENIIINHVTNILVDIFGHERSNIIKSDDKLYDLAVKINDKVRIILKCVSGGSYLDEDCMKDTTEYAVKQNIDWSVLTNGSDWYLFKKFDLLYVFNLIDINPKNKNECEKLLTLCAESFDK